MRHEPNLGVLYLALCALAALALLASSAAGQTKDAGHPSNECTAPVIECDYPDAPVCWCSEVTGSCEWYCYADPIGGLE